MLRLLHAYNTPSHNLMNWLLLVGPSLLKTLASIYFMVFVVSLKTLIFLLINWQLLASPFTHLVVGLVSASTWFPNTGTNQHVTPDLVTLIDSAPYLGNDHLHVGDGKGLSISHIGHTMLRSLKRTFTLSNVLYVSYITKPLLSVQKFIMIIIFILNFTHLYFM